MFVFTRFSYHRKEEPRQVNRKNLNDAAILMAVRNEEQNLKFNLNSIISQKPSGFELLIVDDHSQDGSFEFLEGLKESTPCLSIFKSENSEGKKQALSFGINKTKHEFIVMTDADCIAASDKWMQLMVDGFENDKIEIVLGYSPYSGKGLLAGFIRFETFMTAIQYFSYALAGMSYMGVGRNIAFRKSLFMRNNGFDRHLDVKSGSDDLFINETSNSGNVSVQYDPDSFIYTFPSGNIFDFLRQKARHISTSFRYKFYHKFLLGLFSFTHIVFYFLIIYAFITGYLKIAFLFLVIRYIILYLTSYGAFLKLKEKDLMIWLPVFDFLMFIYYISLSFFYYFYPKNRWK